MANKTFLLLNIVKCILFIFYYIVISIVVVNVAGTYTIEQRFPTWGAGIPGERQDGIGNGENHKNILTKKKQRKMIA